MIHPVLKDIHEEFDKYCYVRNIKYLVEGDNPNIHSYKVTSKCDIIDLLRHISNYVKNKPVTLQYNGKPIDYDTLKSRNFNVSTSNPSFKFILKAIREDDMVSKEDTNKFPGNSHGRRQAAFPSSFAKLKTRDTYENESKKKDKKIKEDHSFGDRLVEALDSISMVEPEILMTRDYADTSPTPMEEPEFDARLGYSEYDDCLKSEENQLSKFLTMLDQCSDEDVELLETIISACTTKINCLRNLRGLNA